MNTLTTYFRGVLAEFPKIKWPSQKVAYALTALVIALSLLIAAYLGALDQLTTYIVNQIVL